MLPPCTIDSPQATIELVAVHPQDAPAFALALEKVHVVARPTALADAPVPVDVRGAIHFSGLANIDEYAPKWPVTLAGGMLRAARGARMVRAGVKGSLLSGTMALTPFLLVENVALPCAALEVPPDAADDVVPANDPMWGIDGGDEPVTFWSQPGWGAKLSVWPGLSFQRIETRGKWTHVAVDLTDGSALHGWVDVAKVSDEGPGGLSGGGFGCGMSFDSARFEVTVRAGTKVSATPDGAPWGTVSRDTKMTIVQLARDARGKSAAMIVDLDGYRDDAGCPGLSHAYIPASSFTLDKD